MDSSSKASYLINCNQLRKHYRNGEIIVKHFNKEKERVSKKSFFGSCSLCSLAENFLDPKEWFDSNVLEKECSFFQIKGKSDFFLLERKGVCYYFAQSAPFWSLVSSPSLNSLLVLDKSLII